MAARKSRAKSRSQRVMRERAKKMEQLAQDRRNNGGAPTTYDPDFARQAAELCKRGATDAELADFFGVTTVTIWNWQTRHQEFFNSVHRNKEAADLRVERALYARATGYTYPSEKIFCTKDGEIIREPITEHVPPSDKAMTFWLTNRKAMEWKERKTEEFDPDKPLKIIVEGGLPKDS